MNLQQISDILDIQNLGYSFADAANRKDYARFASLWAEDGVWHIGAPLDRTFAGRQAIGEAIQILLQSWEFFVQLPHAPVIAFAGDRASASARWTVMEEARTLDGAKGNFNLSFYDDILIKEGGEWRFSNRSYSTRYADESPLRGCTLDTFATGPGTA